MIPRLDVRFSLHQQRLYFFGRSYDAASDEYLLNHARTGMVLALRTSLPNGSRVGVMTYNCHTVANAVVQSGCTPVFLEVTDRLLLQTDDLADKKLAAIIVTNLFGIRNDIEAIRGACPGAVIIVDNAHGYGLPPEGDFTVYSVGQGKFPSLGDGGILVVNNAKYRPNIEKEYNCLPDYGLIAQIKLFAKMCINSLLYSPLLYGWFTIRLKSGRTNAANKKAVSLRKMPIGVSRMLAAALPTIPSKLEERVANANQIADVLLSDSNVRRCWYGENAFMLIAECEDVNAQKRWFFEQGVETETHFKNAIRWAQDLGYTLGDCPMAEYLTKHLLMIPTYRKLNL